MALTRASKTEKVGKLAAELQHSTSAIIGTFKGLTASKDFELRKTVRGAGGSYHVVKNKLAARAAELRATLAYHAQRYYVDDDPEIEVPAQLPEFADADL